MRHAYLCSVPRGGELIEPDLTGEDAAPAAAAAAKTPATVVPTPSAPVSVSAPAAAPVNALAAATPRPLSALHMGRGFSSELNDAAEVDTVNAGTVVVLRRTLKMLRRAVPGAVWQTPAFSWRKP